MDILHINRALHFGELNVLVNVVRKRSFDTDKINGPFPLKDINAIQIDVSLLLDIYPCHQPRFMLKRLKLAYYK